LWVAEIAGVTHGNSVLISVSRQPEHLLEGIKNARPLAQTPEQPLPEQTADAFREAVAAREEALVAREKAAALRRDQVAVRVLTSRFNWTQAAVLVLLSSVAVIGANVWVLGELQLNRALIMTILVLGISLGVLVSSVDVGPSSWTMLVSEALRQAGAVH